MTAKHGMSLVSVGMPVCNGEAFLAEALNSLLIQTYGNLEILISDNCSSDKTKQICLEYAAKDSRIRYFRQAQNIGATANFNYVLQQASGEYFMWSAHDDRWSPNYVELLHARITNDDALSFIYGRSLFIDEKNQVCGRSINNFLSPQWLRNDRKNPDVVNAIAYYLDRSPFKIYGMYRTGAIQKFKFQPFLGSAKYADNVLLLQFLATYEADECSEAIHYYRILPRPPEAYSETANFVRSTHLKVEFEYFKVFVTVLWGRIRWGVLFMIPILPILLFGAVVKPRAIIVKHWLFSTFPTWVRSCLQSKAI
jgi:glycosyltransferase involved in cell wall biosynthesis